MMLQDGQTLDKFLSLVSSTHNDVKYEFMAKIWFAAHEVTRKRREALMKHQKDCSILLAKYITITRFSSGERGLVRWAGEADSMMSVVTRVIGEQGRLRGVAQAAPAAAGH